MRRQNGIAYLGLLLIIILIGIVAGTAADVYQHARQRSREVELLWIGNQYRRAILSYLNTAQGDNQAYPQRLEDLLLDPRFPGVRRHLRRIYRDPMTGKADWELLLAPQGGIAGVRSRSTLTPIKQAGFRPQDEHLEDKTSYTEWEFTTIQTTPNQGNSPNKSPMSKPQ